MKTSKRIFFPGAILLVVLGLLLSAGTVDAAPFFTSGSLFTPRELHTATLLSNGKILIAGGYNGSSVTNTELYDPATGLCPTNGALATGRFEHTATLLPNGKVLVAGGLHTVFGGGQSTSVATATAELYDPVANTWTSAASMNTARFLHTATLLPNGQVLVAAGEITNNVSTNSVEIYDPASDTWIPTGPLGTARYDFTATLLTNGMVLAAGGFGPGGLLQSAEIYNPATGLWTNTPNQMLSVRYHHSATLLPNGRVVVAGGNTPTGTAASTEEYSPATGQWTQVGNMASPHTEHTATLLPNGKVMVVAGFYNNTTAILSTNSAELYDPNTQTWSAGGLLNFARASHTATLLPGGRLVVTGGYNGSAFVSSIETYEQTNGTWTPTGPTAIQRTLYTLTLLTNGQVLAAGTQSGITSNLSEVYNPAVGTWSFSGGMTARRDEHTATLLTNGLVLAAGGTDTTNYLASAETYDATSGTWTATGAMNARHGYHSATLLLNGNVLVAGGLITTTTPTNGSELYNPSNRAWTTTSLMHIARSQHTATLLPNGRVLVAGGLGSNNVYLNNVETFDPATGAWTTNNSMTAARMSHTATLLPNGKVLVAGGFNQSNDWLSSAELYDPANGTWTLTGPMNFSRDWHTATLLPSGLVLVAGGFSMSTALKSAEVYDPATGVWVTTNTMTGARYSASAALLPSGKVLVAGGVVIPGNSTNVELFDPGLGYSNAWQPVISSVSTPLTTVGPLALAGSKFRGIAEGSGGNNGQDSPADFPVVQLRAFESGKLVYVAVTNWSTNLSFCTTLPNFPVGWAEVTLFVNGIPSASSLVNVTRPQGSIVFSNLVQTFDGTTKSAGVTTIPSGLPLTVTYNSSTSPPTNIGLYALSAVITDTNFQGSATNVFQIVAPPSRSFGVDVSHFQNSNGIPLANWQQMVAEGKRFAFVKSTEGLTGPDDTTVFTNVPNAIQAGLLAGVYHFAHPENRPTPAGAVQEADHLLSFAGNFIGPGYLRPVLDLERGAGVLSVSALTDWVLAFSQEIVSNRGPGAAPIIYTLSGYATASLDSRLAGSTLWIATGGGSPTNGQPTSTGVFTNWAFWQYNVGTAGGINPIDLDVCHDEFMPLSAYVIPASFAVSSTTLDAGGFHLSFTNVPGAHFTLVTATNVTTPLTNWVVVGSATEGLPGQYSVTDPSVTPTPGRFYRIKSP